MPSVYLSPSTQEYNLTITGLSEEYFANLITNAMIPYLEASNIDYGRNTPEMTAESSVRQANEGNYDFYLSIHSNASAKPYTGRVRGAEVYYYPDSEEGKRAAEIFANNYKEIYPVPSFVTTIPNANFIELNSTNMPAILFELYYHDNQEDYSWMSQNINNIGRNLSLSVADYFGVPFIEPQSFARGVVTISSGVLNVRNIPSANGRIIGTLNNGDAVNILENENGWYRISFNGADGYVNSRFIRVS